MRAEPAVTGISNVQRRRVPVEVSSLSRLRNACGRVETITLGEVAGMEHVTVPSANGSGSPMTTSSRVMPLDRIRFVRFRHQ